MNYNIGPYDVMRYHDQLINFLDPYLEEIDGNNNLPLQIERTSEVIDRFFRDGAIDYSFPVINTVIMGQTIESITNLPVVKPDNSQWEKSTNDIYAKKLLLEENPWKTIYELEIAKSCSDAGLNTKLVHEGQDPGPDILVYCNNERVDIECRYFPNVAS